MTYHLMNRQTKLMQPPPPRPAALAPLLPQMSGQASIYFNTHMQLFSFFRPGSKKNFREVIKYLYVKGLIPEEIKAELDTPLHSRDKGTGSEDGEDGEIGRKVMASVFWDARGINYTGVYYALLLHRLSEEIKKKRIHWNWSPVTFFIFKLQKMAWQTTIHVERGSHCPNRYLFCGPSVILLFERLKKVGEMLGKVYRVKRRLC